MRGPSVRPCRWVTALLLLIRDAERRELVAGDLEEGFRRRVESGVSVRRARRWYASQALRSIARSLALGLALVGGYSVAAYGVARRSSEFGIRRALGARTHQVMAMVLAEGSAVALTGVFLGVTAALAASRLIESLLFGIDRFEPTVYAGVAATVVLACLAATYVPAWRASRADPLRMLRDP